MGSLSLHNAPSRTTLRKLIDAVLPTDSDVQAFCLDHFASTAQKLSRGMDRTDKTNLLLEREAAAEILQALQKHDPARCCSYRALLGENPATLTFDRSAYAEAMKKKYRAPKLESLDQAGSYYRELDLWRVFVWQHVRECQDYLPQVLELPKEHLRRLHDSGHLDAQALAAQERDEVAALRERYVAQPLQNARDLLEDSSLRQLVILGDPGSGKSSLLQTVVRSFADTWEETKDSESQPAPIPFLIELGAFARTKGERIRDLFDFCANSDQAAWPIARDELQRLLAAGQASLLFDGLDEVFDPGLRGEVVHSIVRLGQDYPLARILVTSRVIGYKGEAFRHADFRHFMLQDLDQEQIAEFLENWHRDTYRPDQAAERREKHERLQAAIADSRAITELAGNPMLLTMMAIVNRSQQLPRERAKLYRQCAELLLDRWKIDEALSEDPALREDLSAFDTEEKQNLLRQVARAMQQGPQGLAGNLLDKDTLSAVIESAITGLVRPPERRVANALVKHLRDRVYILCFLGGDRFGFVHRTFLEFFCADDLRVRFEKKKSLSEDQLIALFVDHLGDDPWQEVLSLLAGLLDTSIVGRIVERLLQICDEPQARPATFLAATCLTEVRRRSDLANLVSATEERLMELMYWDLRISNDWNDWTEAADDIRKVRTLAVHTLAPLALHRGERKTWLKEHALNDLDWIVRVACVETLAKNWPCDPDILHFLKHLARNHPDVMVQRSCIEQIGTHFASDLHSLAFIQYLARNAPDFSVRYVCVHQVGRHVHRGPKAQEFLKDIARADISEYVREIAAALLSRHATREPSTLALLRDLALNDPHETVRQACVLEIGTRHTNAPDTIRFLQYLARNDPQQEVRRACVHQLGRIFRKDPDAHYFFEHLVLNDPGWMVRIASVEQLGSLSTCGPNILSFLKHLAGSAQDVVVRKACINEVGRRLTRAPDTLPFLMNLARTDPEWVLRETCLNQISSHFINASETLPFLMDIARNDHHQGVRQTCVALVGEHFTNQPVTLPFLRSLLHSDPDGHVRAACVRQIGNHWANTADTIALINHVACSDSDTWVRVECIWQLGEQFANAPETLPFLLNLLHRDPDRHVRAACVRQIGRCFKNSPGTVLLLKQLARSDPEQVVRRECVDTLSRHYFDDPETLHLLKDLARNDPSEDVRVSCVNAIGWRFSRASDTLTFLNEIRRDDQSYSVRWACTRLTQGVWANAKIAPLPPDSQP